VLPLLRKKNREERVVNLREKKDQHGYLEQKLVSLRVVARNLQRHQAMFLELRQTLKWKKLNWMLLETQLSNQVNQNLNHLLLLRLQVAHHQFRCNNNC
jgi:hypothetical protein